MARTTSRPLNVLFITADQYRGDFLGIAGHPVVRTPHLDALALAGAHFPNAYSPVPICVPARYAFMTGRVPLSFGVRGNGGRIPADAVTLPQAFAAAGYATAAIGKMHFTPWREPHGFDEFVVSEEGRQWRDGGGDDYQQYLRRVGWGGYERAHAIGNNDVHTSASPLPLEHYHTTWCARRTGQWIREHVAGGGAGGRPFFAWCSFTKPHSPYDPPEPYDRLYDPRAFPPPTGSAADLAALSPHYRQSRHGHLWDSLGPEQVQRARAFYAGSCTLIDQMVGELRRELETLGIADRTVVCFTADHGDLLGDHGLFFKSCYFKAAWHVPLVLFAPGRLEARGACRRFATSQDIYPTLLDLAAVPLPEPAAVHGESLAADPDGGPETVFGSVLGAGRQIHAARTARWSYVVHARGGYQELYDLRSDPEERVNLAEPAGGERTAEAQRAAGELRAGLESWLATVGDRDSLDDGGRLRVDAGARGWEPEPPPRNQLGLRPY